MDQRIEVVIGMMKNRICQDLTINDLALSVYLSRWHFAHLFKAHVGVSPARYLKSLKMCEAKRLLKVSPMSVKEIMFRLRIKDKSHFERDFKKQYGLTPAQYRLDGSRKLLE
jgi:AraC family transcriptional regulator